MWRTIQKPQAQQGAPEVHGDTCSRLGQVPLCEWYGTTRVRTARTPGLKPPVDLCWCNAPLGMTHRVIKHPGAHYHRTAGDPVRLAEVTNCMVRCPPTYPHPGTQEMIGTFDIRVPNHGDDTTLVYYRRRPSRLPQPPLRVGARELSGSTSRSRTLASARTLALARTLTVMYYRRRPLRLPHPPLRVGSHEFPGSTCRRRLITIRCSPSMTLWTCQFTPSVTIRTQTTATTAFS